MIAGVCGGLADYLNVDPTLVRLGFILLTMANGAGILLYLVMTIIVPRAPPGAPPPVTPGIQLDLSWLRAAILLLVGAALVVAGAGWALDQIGPWFWASWNLWYVVRTLARFFWAALLIAVGLIIVAAALRRR